MQYVDVITYKHATSNPLKFPDDYPYDCREVAYDAPEPDALWSRISVDQLNDIKINFSGQVDLIPQNPVPQTVSPRQIRLALNQLGLRATVEQAVASGSQDLRDWWEYALDIERNNALVIGMAGQLGITEQQLDDLFRLASTL